MSRRRKILIVVGIVAGVAILIPVIRHYQLRFAVANYVAELKAKGEPMDLAQVIPPSVPPEQNAAPLITNALSQVYLESNYTNSIIFNNPPYAMNRTIPGKEMIGWHQLVIHDPNGTWPVNLTNTWDDLSAQLAKRQSDLNDFRKLIENPVFDFDYDYSNSKNFIPNLAPHLEQFKLAAQWLESSEFYNLHFNKTTDACDDVRAMLAFVKGERDERFEISQLVRMAIAQISAEATWNILQATNIPDEDLAQLQQDWQSLEFIVPLKNAFSFERISDLNLLNSLRQSPTNFLQWYSSAFWAKGYRYEQTGEGTSARWILVDKSSFPKKIMNKISIPWDKSQWRWFWSYNDELHGLPMWQVVINGTQMLETNHSIQSVQSFINTNFTKVGFDSVKNNPYEIISQNVSSQLAAIRKAVTATVTRNIVITAIALKRYQFQNHQLPKTLSALVPDFLKSIPIDYMDGQPLRYRPNADGTFLLYSIGENGVDDGGDASLEKDVTSSNYSWQNIHALDWVWPQPATEDEIQAYYKKPSSKSN